MFHFAFKFAQCRHTDVIPSSVWQVHQLLRLLAVIMCKNCCKFLKSFIDVAGNMVKPTVSLHFGIDGIAVATELT